MRSRSSSSSGASEGLTACIIMLSKGARSLLSTFRLEGPDIAVTDGPFLSVSIALGRRISPAHTASVLISGSWKKSVRLGTGRPRSMAYPRSSLANPSLTATRSFLTVPSILCSPDFIDFEICSGPAQSVEGRPPSEAREETTRPWAVAASSEIARYRLDLPEPLGPVTRFRRSSDSATFRSDR